jgi:N-methylhydantoinase A
VTDANIVAGRIPADLRLGGTVAIDAPLAQAAMARLGEAAGLGPEAAATGMLEVVDTHMEQALRAVSVEEGADPRDAVLVAFGGAGGLHASRLARRLGIRAILVPPWSGVLSALGLLLATPRSDLARTVMAAEGEGELAAVAAGLEGAVGEHFGQTFGQKPDVVASRADVRYLGQSHELEVPLLGGWGDLRTSFEEAHRQRFGFSREGEPIEVVNLRAVATGRPPMTWADLPAVGGDRVPAGRDGVWQRGSLPVGHVIVGPATVVEAGSTIALEPGDRLTVLEDGTLEIVP